MREGRTLRLLTGRLAAALPSLFGVVIITFLLMRALPGDPAAFFAGPAATPEAVEQVRHRLGLDRSLPAQLAIYLRDLAHGDLGTTITTGQPVRKELINRLELTLAGLALAALIGVPLGVLAATRPGSLFDHTSRLVSTAGVSLPTFFTGLLLIYVFYFKLGWAPPPMGRLDSFTEAPRQITGFLLVDSLLARNLSVFWLSLKQLALPAVTLALFAMAPLSRMTRAAMLSVLSSDYIRTARAAGLGRFQVLAVYGFRNALLPVLTTLGMVFSFLLGANVLVEKVFAWPGLGSFALEALISSDYAPVQGFVLIMGAVYVLLNLLIDVLYGMVDPRARVTG
jgi:ABC-type dipeptide/oligopeptide/nickel transport system permease component